jgi:hypothetical protein
MIDGKYVCYGRHNLPNHYESRKLGADYGFVAAMPLPPRRNGEGIIGVLCVELRDGAISLDSQIMQRTVGLIAENIYDAIILTHHLQPLRVFKDGKICSFRTPTVPGVAAAGAGGPPPPPPSSTPPNPPAPPIP